MPGNTPEGGRTAAAAATLMRAAQGRAPPRCARRMARDAPGCGATNCASLLANQQPPAAAKRAALGGMLLPLGSKHRAARDEAPGQARAAAVDPPIRSTTGFNLPPISLHYKADEFWHDRKLLVKLIGTSPINVCGGSTWAAARPGEGARGDGRPSGLDGG
ncbi:hypothetical protein F511_20170 [Dorcoceras hygrometricum]|uniref:Uncharacterized protein n=1 Tax=Dorcoceras hygrometricum TaxID=472368 RepID=A0A2Z7D8A0_9LAMI|nr:hypothetical protein F511_20170 [Dorcoceras hygrometricum]